MFEVLARFFVTAAILATPLAASSGPDEPAVQEQDPASSEAVEAEDSFSTEPGAEAPAPYSERITVTATHWPTDIKDTPGAVSVIGRERIEELGMKDVSDLLKFEPGVYVASDLTRLGLGGFNIRGIGENRVLTQIDGVRTAEQFDFGPLAVPRYGVDLELLESVEIIRSAGSALYGSDALGGVVSFRTRTPGSYLSEVEGNLYLGLRTAYDGRNDETSESVAFAVGRGRWQGSLQISRRDGVETDNQGRVASQDSTRTRPNPMDREATGALAKLVHAPSARAMLELTAEWYGTDTETAVLSGQGATPAGLVLDYDARDTNDRLRVSAEQWLVPERGILFGRLLWRVYASRDDTRQLTRLIFDRGEEGLSEQNGLLDFEQDMIGAELRLQKEFSAGASHRLTYGVDGFEQRFAIVRDRTEMFVATGEPVPTNLEFPTSYFPDSRVRSEEHV